MMVRSLFTVLALLVSTASGCLLHGETDTCKVDCDKDLPGPSNEQARIQCKAVCHEQLCSQKTWTQVGRDIHGKDEFDSFGHSVDLSDNGRTVAISSSAGGYVRVFDLEEDYQDGDDKWIRRGEDIEMPKITYDNGASYDNGWAGAVSLSSDGMIVAVGDMFSDSGGVGGAVFVYRWNQGSWKWEQMGNTIKGGSSEGEFGRSVSLSPNGKTVAVGSWFISEVRVFQYFDDEARWILKGGPIQGDYGSLFGSSVSLGGYGDIVAVAASADEQSQVSVWYFINDEWNLNTDYSTVPDASTSSVSISQGDGWKVAYASNAWDWQGEPFRVGGDEGNPGLGWIDAVHQYKIDLSTNGRVLAGRGNSGDGPNIAVYALSVEGNPPDPTRMGKEFEGIYGCFDEADRSLALNADGTVFAVASIRCHDDGDGAGLVRVFKFNDEGPKGM